MRLGITWLLVLLMPFQALTAVYLDVLGPAHFHFEHDHHGSLPSHGQDRIERHHHHQDDLSVVTVHDDGLLEPFASGETPSGWSSSMLAVLSAGGASLQPSQPSNELAPRAEHFLYTRFPGRLERPPRIDPA